jgi:FkbM family methyltransferase
MRNSFAEYVKAIDPSLCASETVSRYENGAFVSYSQNLEDVMLNRLFKESQSGFYVDIGAHHPFVKSVTYSLYSRGWRGLNIDMDPTLMRRFDASRQRDINICAAVSASDEIVQSMMLSGSTRSSLDPVVIKNGLSLYPDARPVMQKARRLQSILDEYSIANVELLKIDVEGHESSVIKGIDFTRFKARVILAEATPPLDPTPSYGEWRHLLESCGYELAFFDGLNAFFVSEADLEAKAAFSYPPCFWDNYVRADHLALAIATSEGPRSALSDVLP